MRRAGRISTLGITMFIVSMMLLVPMSGACSFKHNYDYCDDRETYQLIAGQTMPAGKITVSNYGLTLNVVIETTGGWYIVESHVDVAQDYINLEQTKKGNAIPGKFSYKDPYDEASNGKWVWYQIDLSEDIDTEDVECGDGIVVAVHVVVERELCDGSIQEETAWGKDKDFIGKDWSMYLEYELECCKIPTFPGSAYGRAVSTWGSGPSYWKVTFSGLSGDTNLVDGDYLAWCIQTRVYMGSPSSHTWTLYSSLYPPDGSSGSPDLDDLEWDKVNYILNKNNNGEYPPAYTHVDVQYAIWHFMEQPDPDGGDLDLTPRSILIIKDANNNGAGYHPGSNSDDTGEELPIVAIILYTSSSTQMIIIELDP